VFASVDATEGDWYGIVIDSGTVDIEYADISHAYAGIYDKSDGNSSIENCRIADCELYGIRSENANLEVTGTRVENTTYGFHFYDVDGAVIENDTAVDCGYGVYIDGSEVTVQDCVMDHSRVHIHGGADTLRVQRLAGVQIRGGGWHQLYINHGRVEIDSCTFAPADGDSTDVSLLVCWLIWGDRLKVRNTDFTDYLWAGLQLDFVNDGSRVDFGRDTTGEYGNNAIYSAESDAMSVYGTGYWDSLLAQRNWWGEDPPDTSLFRLFSETGDTVQWDPCLSSAPSRAKLMAGEGEVLLPTTFALYQNYPNPFNPSTTISFDIPTACLAKLEIFNILGQKVTELGNQHYAAGRHSAVWSGTNQQGKAVASGVYFYRLKSDTYVSSKKMLLLK
jgi:hypothetical protein